MTDNKRYHVMQDALGRKHFYYGTVAEAHAQMGAFVVLGGRHAEKMVVQAACALCMDRNSSWLWSLADLITDDFDDKPSGFAHGPELIVLMAAETKWEFDIWKPAGCEDFRQQYLAWVDKHIGYCIPTESMTNEKFQLIVAAVLKKVDHPAYAAAQAAHEAKWVPPTDVQGHHDWQAQYP